MLISSLIAGTSANPTIQHAYWEQNVVANVLAKQGCRLTASPSFVLEQPSLFVNTQRSV